MKSLTHSEGQLSEETTNDEIEETMSSDSDVSENPMGSDTPTIADRITYLENQYKELSEKWQEQQNQPTAETTTPETKPLPPMPETQEEEQKTENPPLEETPLSIETVEVTEQPSKQHRRPTRQRSAVGRKKTLKARKKPRKP
jgi:hypothetical protein